MMSSLPAIEKILVVDDNPSVRMSYTYPIQAADRAAVIREQALGGLEQFLASPLEADAAVSDYHLSPGNYASFDGATLVSRWYQMNFPAILCTQFDKANLTRFRVLRRWIPVLMHPDQLDEDSLMHGLELIQKEFRDDYTPGRRPWRALVRFVEFSLEENFANAKLPGRDGDIVALRANDLPLFVREGVAKAQSVEDEYRCYATANLGAESDDDLYLSEWEVPTHD